MPPVIHVSQVHYPESDGKPMGETDEHRDAMVRHIDILAHYYRGQKVYVSGDLLLYYEQGNPKKFIVPDALVVKDLAPGKRRVFKTWVERRVPNVVIETTSRKTRRKDTTEKPELYARLGIKEYFLFDPDQEYLDPPLQGYRLAGTSYVPILPEKDGCLVSQELEMRLCIEQDNVQFIRIDTGERLLSSDERAEQERQRAEQERQRAEQERQRAEQERQRAEQEVVSRQREAERAEREAAARRAVEEEIAHLRAELARRQAPG